MNSSTSKFWKQSVIYVLVLLTGAVITLIGDRLLLSKNPIFAETPRQQLDLPQVKITPDSTNSEAQKQRSVLPINPTDGNFIAAAVQKVGPAVVRIDSSRRVRPTRRGLDGQFPEDFFGVEPPLGRGRVERGTGSGFVISDQGQVLTNAHVVDGADTVSVTLKDGRTFEGKVLGEDPLTDVAVVKIEAAQLPIVTIGNSDQLLPGEWAIAIGNPLGLDNSVTAGIISATGRSSTDIGVPDKRIGFIQTDAAINPGNSGGPLLNAAGEVIGMNTAIISGAQGLGFAIPINDARQIAQQLIATGKVEHAYLGIEMATLTPEIKQLVNSDPNSSIRVNVSEGILISSVVPASPAAKAGFRPGDVIQKINNQPMTKSEAVQKLVQNTKVGSPLQVEVNRNGNLLKLEVRPGNLPVQPSR
ncbi:MAG TPA: HhoA/HhoB/HtrA family serine endopeptidase [Kamptonema sp.]|nr:HhoA/HhoB/HtrA family serine endopeptidase [Kamptonema sp.]